MSDEGRYSKVSRRIWNDQRFRSLSRPKPNGQTLFLRLLTGPELGCIPGLFQAWDAGLAQAMEWSMTGLRKALREVIREGLAEHDPKVGLFWLPKAIHHNEPTSPNVIRSWKIAWVELPDCALKDEARAQLEAWAEAKGKAWAEALREAIGKSSGKPSAKAPPHPSPNQEQEQEQKQEHPKAAEVDPRPPGSQAHTNPDPPPPRQRPPGNLKDALKLPVRERAQLLVDEEHRAQWLQPHKWPELVRLAAGFSEALGWTKPRLTKPTGSPVIGLVHLLAAFEGAELERAIEAAPSDKWLTSGRKGLGSLSVEVVSRLLNPQRSERKPGTNAHRQPDYDGEPTFRAADLFADDEETGT